MYGKSFPVIALDAGRLRVAADRRSACRIERDGRIRYASLSGYGLRVTVVGTPE